MILVRPKSTIPNKVETMTTTTITTNVEARVCFGVGQVTFLSSTLTSFKKCLTFSMNTLILSIHQPRKDP